MTRRRNRTGQRDLEARIGHGGRASRWRRRVVAATDYQRLGTPGLHTDLIGESEGRGTLDGVALGGWAMNAFYEVCKGDHSDMDLDQTVTSAGQRALPASSGSATSSRASTTASSASPPSTPSPTAGPR